jgi:hypothetical protein
MQYRNPSFDAVLIPHLGSEVLGPVKRLQRALPVSFSFAAASAASLQVREHSHLGESGGLAPFADLDAHAAVEARQRHARLTQNNLNNHPPTTLTTLTTL